MSADLILDTAVEAEFILCFTSERAGGTYRNKALQTPDDPSSDSQYQYENTPADFQRWLSDARREGGWIELARDIFRNLEEFNGTEEARFARELLESLPRNGAFLPFQAVKRATESLQEIIGQEISYLVMPRLSVGLWAELPSGKNTNARASRVSEPNVAVRLKQKDGGRIGRHVLEKIAACALALLHQGEVAARLRAADDGQWQLAFFKTPGVDDPPENRGGPDALCVELVSERSLAFFTGSRHEAVRILGTLRGTLQIPQWEGMGMTLELRPDDARSAPPQKHALLVRHGRRGTDQPSETIGNLLYAWFGRMAETNAFSRNPGSIHAGEDLFLPVAHNCVLDLGSYADLACTAAGSACNRWSTRCGFAPRTPLVALGVTECHCFDGGHPRLVIGAPVGDSECVQVEFACCGEPSCPRRNGSEHSWWLPIFPKRQGVSEAWMRRRWGLDWLLELRQASDELARVPDQRA